MDQGCCHLYSGSDFSGDVYEFCDSAGPVPDDLLEKGVDSWVCGPYTEVAFTEGDGAGGMNGYQTFAMSSGSYIYNQDVGASTSPLIKGSVTGPITALEIFDISGMKTQHLGTTMFDQPACAGRSAILDDSRYASLSWDENQTMYKIDTDTVFRSVILEPNSELTLIDKHSESYYSLANYDPSPSCMALPDAEFDTYTYEKI